MSPSRVLDTIQGVTIVKIWMRRLMHKGRHGREILDTVLDVLRASLSRNYGCVTSWALTNIPIVRTCGVPPMPNLLRTRVVKTLRFRWAKRPPSFLVPSFHFFQTKNNSIRNSITNYKTWTNNPSRSTPNLSEVDQNQSKSQSESIHEKCRFQDPQQ